MERWFREVEGVGSSGRDAEGGAPGKRTRTARLARAVRDDKGVAAGAEGAVDRAGAGSGEPLRGDLRNRFEASLDADLSAVRVHTGAASAEASAAVGARAYAVGNDIHFGAGQYQPDDAFGLHLLAHEVAHTRQQAGGVARRQHRLDVSAPTDALEVEADRAADAMVADRPASVTAAAAPSIARDAGKIEVTKGEMVEWWPIQDEVPWNDKYASEYKQSRPVGDSAQKDFDTQRASGKVKRASDQGGIKVKTTVSADQVHRIIAAGGEADAADRCAAMAGDMNTAFETMMIDTAQTQADYMAHMAGESGGKLEEVGADSRPYAVFKGRGPAQVTSPENYAKSLGSLEQRADQLEQVIEERSWQIVDLMRERDQAADDAARQAIVARIDAAHAEVRPLRDQLTLLQRAVNAIKADPTKAADPEFAFLLSAGAMHTTGAAGTLNRLGAQAAFVGNGTADSWVSGGNAGMTFAGRQAQNEDELADINQQLQTATNPAEIAKLQQGAAGRTRLISDMKAAQARSPIKQKVYAKAMEILTAENRVVDPNDMYPE